MPLCFQRNLMIFAKARPAQMIFITTSNIIISHLYVVVCILCVLCIIDLCNHLNITSGNENHLCGASFRKNHKISYVYYVLLTCAIIL